MDIEESLGDLTNFKTTPEFTELIICPAKLNSPVPFDPSINGHDFFSRTISCSCTTNNVDASCKNDNCDEKNFEHDGCRRTRKNEYARQQMKKYREKIKQDPIRYMKYLQGERERNARRKIRKIQSILADNKSMNDLEIIKLTRRKENLMNRARIKFEKDIMMVDLKNPNKEQSDDSQIDMNLLNSSPDEYLDELFNKMQNKVGKRNNAKKGNVLVELPNVHITESLTNVNNGINNQKFKSPKSAGGATFEIGIGNGPFTNLKRVQNDSVDNSWKMQTIKQEPDENEEKKNENDIVEVKQEIFSDEENNSNTNSQFVQVDCELSENSLSSDLDSEEEIQHDFGFNRCCAIVNCPSRYCKTDGIKYYSFPHQQHLRDCWINLIKTKTNQWIIDTESFVCSIHFASPWFQVDKDTGDKMLMLNAVPTIYPNETAAQFDIEIPDIKVSDFEDSNKFQNYYSWSCMKLREQENLLKDQQVIIENQSEFKIIQKKRLEDLCKTIDDLKNNSIYSSDQTLIELFGKISSIKEDFDS